MQDVGKLQIYSNFSNLTTFAPFSRFVSAFCQSLTQLFNALVAKTNTIGDVAYCIVQGTTQSIPTATRTDVVYLSAVTDTHNGYNKTTGIYTVPFDGMATITASARLEVTAADWASGEVFRIALNRISTGDVRYGEWMAQTGTSADPQVVVTSMLQVSKGDQLKIYVYQDSGSAYSLTSSSSNLYNYMQIAIDQRI